MQSGREDILEERYAIEFCFKLGKNTTVTYGMLQNAFGASCMNWASVLNGIRVSRKAGSLWDMMKGVWGVRKSIHQSWLAKGLGLGLGLLCWGFKLVQERMPSEEASALQIELVAFPPGPVYNSILVTDYFTPVYNSILVTDYLTKMGINIVPHRPYSPDLAPGDFCFFPKLRGCRYETIEEMKEAVTNVIDTPTQEDFHGGLPEVVVTGQVHCSWRRLLRRGLEFPVCTVNKTAHTKKKVRKLI